MEELESEHSSWQWRPFTDSCKVILKAVLPYDENKLHSIPLALSVHMKETYENLQVLLQKIGHEEHRWNICTDLTVIVMLIVLPGGYTKFCCFECEWDGRARDCH
jgi:hypothetical protein